MRMVWLVILALGAGSDGHPAPSARADLRPAVAPSRRAEHRPFNPPWTASGLDEFEAAEDDESWLLTPDASGWAALAWVGWGPPRSTPGPGGAVAPGPPPDAPYPLRC